MLKKAGIYLLLFFMLVGMLGSSKTYADALEATLEKIETTLAEKEETKEAVTEKVTETTTVAKPEAVTEAVTEVTTEAAETVTETTEAKKDTKKETKKETKQETKTETKKETNKETKKTETKKTETKKEQTEKKQEIKYTVKDIEKKTMYATTSLNVRKGPGTSYSTLGSLSYAEGVTVTGTVNDSHWVRVEFKGKTGYASGKYLADKKPAAQSNNSSSSSKVSGFPIKYSDSSCSITITKEWFENAYVYAAHITFSDYSRFGTTCGKGKYGGTETTTSAAKRVGALLAVNGCYSAPYLEYPVARSGKVMNDKNCWVPAVYSRWNGKLMSAWETGGTPGIAGVKLSSLVSDKLVSDTFSFGPPILAGGSIKAGSDSSRAQRTFIGTNGNAGDIWLFVSDGRNNDGKSSGLTYKQCARYMQSKGCSFGVPLDGGGSSTMVWKGQVLNGAKGNQRSVVDFVYFK